MKLKNLMKETTQTSNQGLTLSTNFDVIPVRFGSLQRNITGGLSMKKSSYKKKKRQKKTVAVGPDIYFGGEGGGL